MLRGQCGSTARNLCVSCQPSIETYLKSLSMAIVWDWLAGEQVELAIDNLKVVGPVVLFSCWTAMDMVSKHATEHAALGLCTVSF